MREVLEVAPNEWDDLLDRIGVRDVYFRRAYLESAELLGQGRPAYLHFEAADAQVVFPVLVRDAPDGYADVGTPMGYGGPVGSGDVPASAAFFDAYDAWCRENRVVATFARFHPVLTNQLLAERRWHVERIGSSVAWRVVGRSRDELVATMDSHHRRIVRKGSAAGVDVTIETAPPDLAEFVALYEETMRRRTRRPSTSSRRRTGAS